MTARLSPSATRLLDIGGGAAALISLVPPMHLPPDARAAWQCVVLFGLVAFTAAAERWRLLQTGERATAIFWSECAGALPTSIAACVLAMSSGPCEPLAALWNAGWALWPTVMLGAAVGVLAGSLCRTFLGLTLAVLGIGFSLFAFDWAQSAINASMELWDHLGIWSVESSAHTQSLFVTADAILFRLGTMALAALLVAAAPVELPTWRGAWLRGVAAPLGGASLVALLTLAAGLWQTEGTLALRLGASREVAPYVVHHDSEIDAHDLAQFEEELRYHHEGLAPLFGTGPSPFRVFLYRDAEQQLRLTGDDRAAYALPATGVLHVALGEWPHPALRHELVHVMAARWTQNPWGVPGEWMFDADFGGLVEGLAEALGTQDPQLVLHEDAAALKRLGTLPDLRVLMGPDGFVQFDEQQAYTAAGSFVRWLIDSRGVDAVRTAYDRGEFLEGLEPLVSEWERFLEGMEVDETVLQTAQALYVRPEPWSTPCWREAEACRATADAAESEDEAERWFRRCLRANPADLDCRLGLAEVLQDTSPESWRLVRETLKALGDGERIDATRLARAHQLAARLAEPFAARAHAAKALEAGGPPWVQLESWLSRLEEENPSALWRWFYEEGDWSEVAMSLLEGSDTAMPAAARAYVTDELVKRAWADDDCETAEVLLVRFADPDPRRAPFARDLRDRCAFRQRLRKVPGVADAPVP